MRIAVYMAAVSATLAAFVVVFRPFETGRGEVVGRREFADGSGYVELLSDPYRLDQIYTSMTGPSSNQAGVRIADERDGDETIWLTGIETNVVNADDRTRISNEFFCHANLTLSPDTTDPRNAQRFVHNTDAHGVAAVYVSSWADVDTAARWIRSADQESNAARLLQHVAESESG